MGKKGFIGSSAVKKKDKDSEKVKKIVLEMDQSESSKFKGSEEDRKEIKARIDEIKSVMTEEEKKRTTYAVALVRTKDGKKEMWISSAGQKGLVRTDIKKNDKVIKNKRLEGNGENRLNDAEQTLMREADAQGAEILAMGASRDMCPKCQDVARPKGILPRMVTPLKKVPKKKLPNDYFLNVKGKESPRSQPIPKI